MQSLTLIILVVSQPFVRELLRLLKFLNGRLQHFINVSVFQPLVRVVPSLLVLRNGRNVGSSCSKFCCRCK